MRWKRAKRFVKQGLAKICKTKDGFLYLKLKFQPSGEEMQEVYVGWDPGSKFDGISVLTRHCHHLNIELIHTKDIKKRMEKRAMYRRIRRSRLWHRPARFNNRTKSKLPPTIQSKVNFRIFILDELLKIFPITRICIEDVRFNHRDKKYGKYFSLVELGKSKFYDYIKSLNLNLIKYQGYDTHNFRIKLFKKDLKDRNKASKSFFAHCLDSTSLGVLGLTKIFRPKYGYLNKCVYYIEHNYLCRRELFRLKSQFGEKKFFVKYTKGGEKIPFKKLCKPRKIRVKIDNNTKSNHGPWKYIYQTVTESFHQESKNYGGTIVNSTSRWNEKDLGTSKRLVLGNYHEYQNRNVIILKE